MCLHCVTTTRILYSFIKCFIILKIQRSFELYVNPLLYTIPVVKYNILPQFIQAKKWICNLHLGTDLIHPTFPIT